MGKTRDLAKILSIVILGMFIPFLCSIILTFNLDIKSTTDLLKIAISFGYFLIFFGLELFVVYLYFQISNKIARKKFQKYKPK
jgi:hypothetical protein